MHGALLLPCTRCGKMDWWYQSRRKTCLSPADLCRRKKSRLSRDVATDIDWVIRGGRTPGVRARLHHKLDYLLHSCSGELTQQNDLFRQTYALELVKQSDWGYHVVSDREWSGWRQNQPPASVNSIFLLKSALDTDFNNDRNQVMTIPVKIGGKAAGLNALLKTCGWEAVSNDGHWKRVTISEG